jgi:DNA-binding MarR family transcriptional regulator
VSDRPTNPKTRDAAAEASEAAVNIWLGKTPIIPRIASELGLAPPEILLLRYLGEDDALPQRALAQTLHCDASYVTLIVDRLEQRGAIERHPDPDDRRVKRIVLTDAGRELRERILQRLYEPPPAIRNLSKADQRALRDILCRAVKLDED